MPPGSRSVVDEELVFLHDVQAYLKAIPARTVGIQLGAPWSCLD